MAIPSTGPITSGMIQAQYGGGAPFRLQDYYRGGARVPNTGANAGIPTSGPISFANFRGQGGGGALPLSATNAGASGTVIANAPATRTVTASGTVSVTGGSGSYTCTWTHLSGDASIPTPGANVFNPTFSASVAKDSTITAVKRCTVSDGSSSTSTDMNVSLTYSSSV